MPDVSSETSISISVSTMRLMSRKLINMPGFRISHTHTTHTHTHTNELARYMCTSERRNQYINFRVYYEIDEQEAEHALSFDSYHKEDTRDSCRHWFYSRSIRS